MITGRLWFLAGVALVIAGLVATVFYYRGNAITAHAKTAAVEAELGRTQAARDAAIEVNKENKQVMEEMVAEAYRRDLIIKGMADDIGDLNRALLDKSEAYNALKEADADVNRYLNSSMPPSVRCMRDAKSCPAPGGGQK